MRAPLVWVLLSAASVQAAISPDVARFLAAARVLLDEVELDRALEQAQRARTAAKTPDDEVLSNMWEGVLLLELSRNDEAEAAFETALAISPDAKLPVTVAPKIAADFAYLRWKVKRKLGLLRDEPATAPAEAPPPRVPTAVAPAPPSPSISPLFWPLAIGGGALIATGGYFAVQTRLHWDALQSNQTLSNPRQFGQDGSTDQLVALVTAGAGAAALIAAVVVRHGRTPPPITLLQVRGATGFAVQGTLP